MKIKIQKFLIEIQLKTNRKRRRLCTPSALTSGLIINTISIMSSWTREAKESRQRATCRAELSLGQP